MTRPELVEHPLDVDPWIGRTLGGRYAIERLLGEGTAGVVYRARHMEMDKPVAVKLLHGMALGRRRAEMEERFRLEARVYGQVTHPHVCAATDYGVTDDGARYLVMELLEGRTLAQAIGAEAPLDPERAVAIGMQIAEGLSAVHDLGVVHRDLKPENVFLVGFQGQDDWVKLVDFGIARSLDDNRDGRLTGAGMIYGTPAYLAPEQTRTMDVDPRADLYALGVILFEMLAGRLPFERDTPLGFMQAHAMELPPMLSEVNPSVPRALSRLVDQLLAKDPQLRPPTADSVRGLLALSLDVIEPVDANGLVPQHRRDPVGSDIRPPHVTQVPTQPVTRFRDGTIEQSAMLQTGAPGISRTAFVAAVVGVAMVALAVGYALSGDGDGEGRAAAGGLGAAVDDTAVSRGGRDESDDRGRAEPEDTPPVIELPLPAMTPKPKPPTLASEKAKYAATKEVREALQQLQSNPQLTQNVFRREVAANPKNAHAHYFLGLALHDLGHQLEAAESWYTALGLDPRYGADPELAQRLLDDYGINDEAQRRAAEKALLKGRVLAQDTPAMAKLVLEGMNADLIARVHGLAKRSGMLEEMPALNRELLVLRAVANCEARAKALVKLNELDDAAALPILRRLQSSTRGCGANGNDDCIACIRPLLERVISGLGE